MRKKEHKEKYLWTFIVFLFILTVMLIPDLIYYYGRTCWSADTNLLGLLCTFARKKGFSYTGSLKTLKNNFSILITAMSVIITMCVNNLNRSEISVFGLKRSDFNFSAKMRIYKNCRRMIFPAPLVMIVAVNFGFSILGYEVLVLCYLFVVFSYAYFEGSFSRDEDLVWIVKKLLRSVGEDVRDQEDISEYRMLLNVMRQWNDREHYWEGANYLFREICNISGKDNSVRIYIRCCCFYETMYVRDNKTNEDRAVFTLKEYITQRDRQGWTESDYLVLWGMMHSLLAGCGQDAVLSFIKWYLDFPSRSRRLAQKYNQKDGAMYNRRLAPQVICMQTGILLIEMEMYFNYTDYVDGYILHMLPQIWSEGKVILDEVNKNLRETYLEINALYGLVTDDVDLRLRNLCTDYQCGTKKSMTAYYLKYN